jgi:hypothetical protein
MNKGRQRPFAAIVQTHFDDARAVFWSIRMAILLK